MDFKNFTKSNPLLIMCMTWCKYYIKVTQENSEKENNILYSYSIIICKNEMINRIISNKWKFENITYDTGFIYID